VTQSDEELATRARGGDRASFDELAGRYAQRIFRFAWVRLRDAHDAEEAAQETLLKVWSGRERYDARRPFATWLFAIAHRETVNVLRRRRRDARAQQAVVPADRAPAREPGGNGDIWTLAARILDDETLTALYLRYATDRTPGEIARIIGRSGGWVRVALHRARAAIGAALPRPSERGPALTALPAGGKP
jgi:RNA polymerase sigma-70 factor (ECF subfamily)